MDIREENVLDLKLMMKKKKNKDINMLFNF